jgi:hypothetical protein
MDGAIIRSLSFNAGLLKEFLPVPKRLLPDITSVTREAMVALGTLHRQKISRLALTIWTKGDSDVAD